MSNIAYILYVMANIPTNIESKWVCAIDNWVFIDNCLDIAVTFCRYQFSMHSIEPVKKKPVLKGLAFDLTENFQFFFHFPYLFW